MKFKLSPIDKVKLKTIYLLVLGVLLFSCSAPEVEMKEIKNVSLSGVFTGNIKSEADVVIENKSNFNLNIANSDLAVFTDSLKLCSLKLLEPLEIKKNSSNTYRLKFSVQLSPMKNILFSFMNNGIEKDKLTLKGTVEAKYLIFKRNIKVDIPVKSLNL